MFVHRVFLSFLEFAPVAELGSLGRLETLPRKPMNRLLSIAGFLAAGTTAVWVWVVLCLPWLNLFGTSSPTPISHWLLWGAVSFIGVSAVYAFVRFSIRPHWAALRRNSPLPATAWRGVCGVYLLLVFALGLPVLHWPSGIHQPEKYFYIALVVGCFVLGTLAVTRGFGRHNAT